MVIMQTLQKVVQTSRLARPADSPGGILTMLTCLIRQPCAINLLMKTVTHYSLRFLVKAEKMSQGSKKYSTTTNYLSQPLY